MDTLLSSSIHDILANHPTTVQAYLLGRLHLKLGDLDRLEKSLQVLDQQINQPNQNALARKLYYTLKSLSAYQQGRFEEVLAYLDETHLEVPFGTAQKILYDSSHDRYLRAEVLYAQGHL